MGANITDIRSIAMDGLKIRLNQPEYTRRSGKTAAHENLSGTSQIHRAIRHIMEAWDFPTLIEELQSKVRQILMVDFIALVSESPNKGARPLKANLVIYNIITIVLPVFNDTYLTKGHNIAVRIVVLRKVLERPNKICDPDMALIQSGAALRLSIERGLLTCALILSAEDHRKFCRQQGTDLLVFFSSFFERTLRCWLAC